MTTTLKELLTRCLTQLNVIHNTETLQANGTAIIDGVLDDDGLTVFLRLPGSRRTLLERFCVRFGQRELQRIKIGHIPDRSDRFCDVSTGETSEGLVLNIESHRAYEADSQGNAYALKV